MRHFWKYTISCAVIASGSLAGDAKASVSLSKLAEQAETGPGRAVTSFHRPAHTDCKKDDNGSHWHKGVGGRRVSCPGGKK